MKKITPRLLFDVLEKQHVCRYTSYPIEDDELDGVGYDGLIDFVKLVEDLIETLKSNG